MFKRLFCKHEYKLYNTKVEYGLSYTYGYNVFEFVCPKCGKTTSVDEWEIDDTYNKSKSTYKKNIAMGGEAVEHSEFSIPRHMNCGILYRGAVATLVLEKYKKLGIDLKQIEKMNQKSKRW